MKLVGDKKGIHTPEFHKKKKREQTVRLVLLGLIAILIIALPIYLLRTKHFLISNVQIKGNSVTADADIEAIVSRDLAGDYLWIFPKSNDLLYSEDRIKKDLLAGIPRLDAASVSLASVNSLSVAVAERQPFALYCTDISDPNEPTNCFFLDKSGYIFDAAPSFSEGVYMVYSSEPPIASPVGQDFLDATTFPQLNPFIENLGEVGLYPKVFLATNGEYHLILSNGGIVEWNASQDLDSIRTDLEAFLVNPSFLKEKDALNNILYIDLRFQNKIFFKFRDGE